MINGPGAAERPRQHSGDWCETERKNHLDAINYCWNSNSDPVAFMYERGFNKACSLGADGLAVFL
jgi:hypothetical protein